MLVKIQWNKLLRFVAFTHPLLHTEHLFYLSLPFNPTSNRLKGNRSQWPLKADHIHVNPQNQSCQIMLVLCLIHFVSTLPFIQPAKRARLTRSSICSIPLAFSIGHLNGVGNCIRINFVDCDGLWFVIQRSNTYSKSEKIK